MPNVLTISDLHCPFHHKGAIDFLADLKRKYKPKIVVALGDEVDAAAWSTFDKDPSMPSPADELEAAKKALKSFYKLFPNVLVCESNHPARLYKRASEKGLLPAMMKDIGSIYDAPRGWQRAASHVVNGVRYMHGDGFSGQQGHVRAATGYRQSVVMGHLHAVAGVSYLAGPNNRIWAMCAGCLIDDKALAFAYGKHTVSKPNLGTGVILDGVPHFIPLE